MQRCCNQPQERVQFTVKMLSLLDIAQIAYYPMLLFLSHNVYWIRCVAAYLDLTKFVRTKDVVYKSNNNFGKHRPTLYFGEHIVCRYVSSAQLYF